MEGGHGLMVMRLRKRNKGSLATWLSVPLFKSGTARLWATSNLGWAHAETFLEGLTQATVAKKTRGLHEGSWGPGPSAKLALPRTEAIFCARTS